MLFKLRSEKKEISRRLSLVLWGITLTGFYAFAASHCVAQQASQPASQPASQAAPPAQPAQQYPELPAGPGKDTLIRVCGQCHSPDNVLANGQTQQGWENTITKMAGFGAAGTDEDFTAILDYLTKNFPPPTNVNKATAQEIATGLSLPETQAEAIVAYREKNGNFRTIDDLKKVPGLDAKKLDAEKTRLAF